MGQFADSDHDIGAARLHLFAFLSTVRRSSAVREDRVVIRPGSTPMAYDHAIELMARLPKPTVCTADLEGETLAVSCRAVAGLSSPEREHFATHGSGSCGLMHFVGEHHSGDIDRLPVLCIGRGSLEVTVGGAERWYRDYR